MACGVLVGLGAHRVWTAGDSPCAYQPWAAAQGLDAFFALGSMRHKPFGMPQTDCTVAVHCSVWAWSWCCQVCAAVSSLKAVAVLAEVILP